jgi:hypothetical protein
MRFKQWFLEGFRALHQVGFMPGSTADVAKIVQTGTLMSDTGLIWLRPESSVGLFRDMSEFDSMVWVQVEGDPKLLTVANRDDLMQQLGVEGHTDIPEVSRQVAERLREMGYDGFERKDFPEMAILSHVPHKVTGIAAETP